MNTTTNAENANFSTNYDVFRGDEVIIKVRLIRTFDNNTTACRTFKVHDEGFLDNSAVYDVGFEEHGNNQKCVNGSCKNGTSYVPVDSIRRDYERNGVVINTCNPNAWFDLLLIETLFEKWTLQIMV